MYFSFDLTALPEIKNVYHVTRRTVWQIVDPHTLLIFCTDGRCQITMDNRRYELNAGKLLIVPAGHHYVRRPFADEFCTLGYVHLALSHTLVDDDEAARLLHEQRLSIDNAALSGEAAVSPHRYFCPLLNELSDVADEVNEIINQTVAEKLKNSICHCTAESINIIRLLLLLATRAQSEAPVRGLDKPTDSEPSHATSMKLRNVFAYIRMHARESITLDDLCRICNFSKQHLIRVFNSEFGMTPKSYILNYRINCAKEYFYNNPYLSVKEVAEEMGFSDQHYFSKMFTKITGITPTAYKRHLINFDPSKQ